MKGLGGKVSTESFHDGHDEVRCIDRSRPTGGHRLCLGEEPNAIHSMLVGIAERGAFPASEGVIGHRNRDRDVDPHHACLDAARELTCDAAAAGEDRGAVSLGMLVYECQSRFERCCMHELQHGPEDLVSIALHGGCHAVEQRGPGKETMLVALKSEPAAIDH